MSLFKRGIARLKMGVVDLVGGTIELASNFANDVEHEAQQLRQEQTRKDLGVPADTLDEQIDLIKRKINLCRHCKDTNYDKTVNWDEDIAFLEIELEQLRAKREPEQMELPI